MSLDKKKCPTLAFLARYIGLVFRGLHWGFENLLIIESFEMRLG